MDDWRVEETKNQARFRDFNEWIKASNQRMGSRRQVQEYICECGDATCREAIEMSSDEYEAIRAEGNRFVTAVNHEDPEFELVVRDNGRFTTIEKLPGQFARIARESDPRAAAQLEGR